MFQFTHPGKGATDRKVAYVVTQAVSIHAPWEGCDEAVIKIDDDPRVFQFTHPGKGATYRGVEYPFGHIQSVSIHAPWEGCDYNISPKDEYKKGFNSRTLGRVRHRFNPFRLLAYQFQFTHPGKGATRAFFGGLSG